MSEQATEIFVALSEAAAVWESEVPLDELGGVADVRDRGLLESAWSPHWCFCMSTACRSRVLMGLPSARL